MNNIVQIITLIKRRKIGKINIITSPDALPGKQTDLFNFIKEGRIKEDADALELLYGSNKKTSGFIKLKQRLLDKLYDTILFIDQSEIKLGKREQAIVRVTRLYVVMKLLVFFGLRKVAMDLGSNLYSLCDKYEISDFGLFISRELMKYFGYIKINTKKYIYYKSECKKWLDVINCEMLVEFEYCKISSAVVKTKNLSKIKQLINYKETIDIIYSCISVHKTNKLLYLSYQIITYVNQIYDKHQLCINACEEVLEIFKSKPFTSSFNIFYFNRDQVVAYLNLNKLNEARSKINLSLQYVPDGSISFFNVKRYSIFISVLNQDWNSFCSEIINISSHKGINKYPAHVELWGIRLALAKFLVSIGKAEVEDLSKFKLYKFLNEVPKYSKDKSGTNVTILIVQLLFLLKDRKYGKIEEKLDALNQYSYRYLKDDASFRANCLIKMLLKLPEAEYHPLRVKRYVARYEKKLASKPYEVNEQNLDVEIIPFDILWELVLELLDNNLKQKKKRKNTTKKEGS